LHQEKHSSLKTSADERRMISTKPAPPNAQFSIRDNLDPVSMELRKMIATNEASLTQDFNLYRKNDFNQTGQTECLLFNS
jgi:type VI protein secretion system component Hcp